MSTSRLETLLNLVKRNPADSFMRYGLAMEYRNTGNLEAAVAEFGKLMEGDPDYAPAYFHGGQTWERLGRLKEARELYAKGVEVTTRKGDLHARGDFHTLRI